MVHYCLQTPSVAITFPIYFSGLDQNLKVSFAFIFNQFPFLALLFPPPLLSSLYTPGKILNYLYRNKSKWNLF